MAGQKLEEKAAAAKQSRPVHVYTIPEQLANGMKEIGLVTLTAEEELLATKRARGDNFRLAYELVKQSLYEVNGERIRLADGSADTAWDKMDPKVRQLLLTAYASLHSPEDDAVQGFLKSQRVKVE